MQRTIVYPLPPHSNRAAMAAAGNPQPASPPDRYGDKLVKYIPAEVIGFYVSVYALVQQKGIWAQVLILVVCLFGTIGYLLMRADPAHPPRMYFYVLAVVAFLAWALGTSTLGQDTVNLPDYISKLAVLSAVFLVPMIDELLTKYLP